MRSIWNLQEVCLLLCIYNTMEHPERQKISFFCRFLMLLAALGVFRQVCISFLRPGHSHEDLDQIFSQVGALLAHSEFSTPFELLELLDGTCRPDAGRQQRQKKSRLSKISASACMLDQSAEWKAWSSVVGVTLRGLRLLACLLSCILNIINFHFD